MEKTRCLIKMPNNNQNLKFLFCNFKFVIFYIKIVFPKSYLLIIQPTQNLVGYMLISKCYNFSKYKCLGLLQYFMTKTNYPLNRQCNSN